MFGMTSMTAPVYRIIASAHYQKPENEPKDGRDSMPCPTYENCVGTDWCHECAPWRQRMCQVLATEGGAT